MLLKRIHFTQTESILVPFFIWCVAILNSDSLFSQTADEFKFKELIAPIFSKHCVECHNGQSKEGGLNLTLKSWAFKGGDSGDAIVPRDVDASLLWQKVSSNEMPPDEKNSISDEEKDLLKRWIEAGADWTVRSPISQYEHTTNKRAGYDWWSLKKIERPAIPSGNSSSSPIDRFVDKRLKDKGLARSSEATKEVLIRRIYFDLLGLPPDPDSVEEFVNDRSEDAYEKLVDRVLASPRYGERWGRHWLDIAHYADTHGFERDQRRLNAWRYRDYVIQSLNDDRPYDEFVKQQIAGDVFDPDNVDANIATGFLACGPYDFTGQEETVSPTLKRQAIADDLDDMLTTVITSTMGLTVNCARCHDHKFDPITQKDYYELSAVFAGVTKKDRVITNLEKFSSLKNRKAELNVAIANITSKIKLLDKSIDLSDIIAGGDGTGNAPGGLGLDPRTGVFAKGNTGMLKDTKVNTFVRGLSRFVDGCFIPDGGKDLKNDIQISSSGIKIKLPKTSGVCWDYFQKGPCNSQDFTDLDDVDYNANGHTLLSIHSNKGITFDLDEFRTKLGVAKLRFTSTMGFGGKHLGSSADVYIFVDGKKVFEKKHVGRKTGGTPIDLTMENSSRYLTLVVTDGGNGIGHDQIFFGDAWIRNAENTKEFQTQLQHYVEKRTTLQNELQSIVEPKAMVYAAVGKEKVGPVHLLVRGNPETKGFEVLPKGLSCITDLNSKFGSTFTAESVRRQNIANWIVDRNNPLTPRVLVNRLWHYHFGQGLVNTPSDFGFLGGRPSHPKLLDWLASELVESNWSIKHIQRLIVTSETYRQQSFSSSFAMQVDAENRLLWRMNPRRLETEAIRDAILCTSGAMNYSAGGPGYQDFEYLDKYAPVYKFVTADRPELWRRTVYRFTVRSVPNRFMKVLDCPNPSSLTPTRNETTTALQSLTLLNNPFMIDQAKHFAKRLEKNTSHIAEQIELAFRLAFSRSPTKEESLASQKLIEEHGLFYFCRALFNANEFIYLD